MTTLKRLIKSQFYLWYFLAIKRSFNKYVHWGGEEGSLKSEQKRTRGGGSKDECTFTFLKNILRFSKWGFIVILQFFLLIIVAVKNIKQTIIKDYNTQSCQWMARDRFCQPFLLCTTFRSFLFTVHFFFFFFFYAFAAKMATYSLVIGNVYFLINS